MIKGNTAEGQPGHKMARYRLVLVIFAQTI